MGGFKSVKSLWRKIERFVKKAHQVVRKTPMPDFLLDDLLDIHDDIIESLILPMVKEAEKIFTSPKSGLYKFRWVTKELLNYKELHREGRKIIRDALIERAVEMMKEGF